MYWEENNIISLGNPLSLNQSLIDVDRGSLNYN